MVLRVTGAKTEWRAECRSADVYRAGSGGLSSRSPALGIWMSAEQLRGVGDKALDAGCSAPILRAHLPRREGGDGAGTAERCLPACPGCTRSPVNLDPCRQHLPPWPSAPRPDAPSQQRVTGSQVVRLSSADVQAGGHTTDNAVNPCGLLFKPICPYSE